MQCYLILEFGCKNFFLTKTESCKHIMHVHFLCMFIARVTYPSYPDWLETAPLRKMQPSCLQCRRKYGRPRDWQTPTHICSLCIWFYQAGICCPYCSGSSVVWIESVWSLVSVSHMYGHRWIASESEEGPTKNMALLHSSKALWPSDMKPRGLQCQWEDVNDNLLYIYARRISQRGKGLDRRNCRPNHSNYKYRHWIWYLRTCFPFRSTMCQDPWTALCDRSLGCACGVYHLHCSVRRMCISGLHRYRSPWFPVICVLCSPTPSLHTDEGSLFCNILLSRN